MSDAGNYDRGGVLDAARRYVRAGISVFPVKPDGSKSPAFPGWRAFSERLPTDIELRRWFGAADHYGIGVPGGPASGNLIVYDFESAAVWGAWLAKAAGTPLAGMLARSPVVRTPSGGRHVWVRLPSPQPGKVLARDANRGTLIETRGYGQYVVAPGSPARCHQLNVPYQFEQTGWLNLEAAA